MFKEFVIPITNYYAKKQDTACKESDFIEFCHVLGLLIAVEVYEICGPQRMYWASNVSNLFPGMDFSKIMSGS